MLRNMEWMQEFERYTVWYCKYGDDRAKPTDIWTNSKTWKPRPMCKNFKYNKETGEVIDKQFITKVQDAELEQELKD